MIDLTQETKKLFPSTKPPRLQLFRKYITEEEDKIILEDPVIGRHEIQRVVDRKRGFNVRGDSSVRPRRTDSFERVERRRAVLRIMRQNPSFNSKQIAKRLGLPRGTIWHDIMKIRKVNPDVNDKCRKKGRGRGGGGSYEKRQRHKDTSVFSTTTMAEDSASY